MLTESNIYWITRLDEIKNTASGIGVIACLLIVCGGIIFTFVQVNNDLENDFKHVRKLSWVIPGLGILLSIFCMLINTFVPTTKEMAAIIVIPKLIQTFENNEHLQKFPAKIIALAESWMEEISPKNVIDKKENK